MSEYSQNYEEQHVIHQMSPFFEARSARIKQKELKKQKEIKKKPTAEGEERHEAADFENVLSEE